jgi:hypothetical protein
VAPPDAYQGKAGKLETTKSHPDVTCQNIIRYVKSKDCMWKGKVDGRSNHLRTLVWVLFIRGMSGECNHKTDLKAHHLKSTSKYGNTLSLQGRSSVSHYWHSMMIFTQSMGDDTLFWVINVLL